MSLRARLYIGFVTVTGISVLAGELWRWESQDLIRFFCYLGLAMVACRLKVSLPAITGTMSLFFIFILFGIVELSLPETLVIGCTATLIQCLWKTKVRPKPHQVVFNVGSMALAITTTNVAYHSKLLSQGQIESVVMLVIAAVVFFA